MPPNQRCDKMKKLDFSTKIIVLLVCVGVVIYVLNFLFLFSTPITVVSIAIVVSGPLLFQYKRYKENKEIEERFPDFLRDVTENIKAGMTLTQAVMATKNTYYGALTPHIKKIVTKIDWSIPFDQILSDFSNQSTPLIKKTISTIIETYAGGGDISQILEAAGKTIKEINKIRKERFSSIYNQMVTGYAIFFIFIGVLIILEKFLVPSLLTFSSPELGMANFQDTSKTYYEIFQLLIVVEGFFSGLVIGKMAEGSMMAGLKHSLILTVIGYSAFFFFV
jgi:flagellar protein FlaJ